MRTVVPAVSIAVMLAGSASADLIVDLGDNTFSGGQFATSNGWAVTGTLTAVSISFDYVGNFDSYPGDLALVINETAQFGGFDDMFMHQYIESYWNFNTTSDGHYEDTVFNDSGFSASTYNILIGNDYITDQTAQWNNVIVTFHGVNGVPAPGAIALLGLAGLAGRRRRA